MAFTCTALDTICVQLTTLLRTNAGPTFSPAITLATYCPVCCGEKPQMCRLSGLGYYLFGSEGRHGKGGIYASQTCEDVLLAICCSMIILSVS